METLIIGYGNTLRGDDGVGYRVAETVEGWALPGVRAIACHQLTPELAAELAGCDRVLFVDASLPGAQTAVEMRPLQSAPTPALDPHRSDPTGLLHLAAQLYDAHPEAHHLLIPTAVMDFSETLSAIARAGMEATLAQVRKMLER